MQNIITSVKEGGGTLDICHILILYWFEFVLYLDPFSKLAETTMDFL
jgi:hypothetical protein